MQNRLTDEQFAFIKYLTGLNTDNNRDTLAVLRRGLSGDPAEDLSMYRFVAPKVPDYDRGTRRENVYYLVAALYALNPKGASAGNFGDHMKLVARQRKDQEAAERRFTALLNARMDDLSAPLRQAVTMLKQLEPPISVNWAGLFADLLRWDHPRKLSQRSWANSFWGYEHPAETDDHQSADNQ